MTESKKTDDSSLAMLLTELIKTSEFRDISSEVTRGIIESWAGNQPLKKKLGRYITDKLETKDRKKPVELAALFSDPLFLDRFHSQIPVLLKGFSGILETYFQQLSNLPPNTQQQVIEGVTGSLTSSDLASISNSLFKTTKSIQEKNPAFFSEQLGLVFAGWFSQTDFGEIKETLKLSENDISAAVKSLNDTVWRYPAKLIILLSFIPDLFNLSADGLKETLSRFNQAPPDLITDILTAMISELDASRTADLINELTELINKIQVGSALIGEPGSPLLQQAISDFSDQVYEQVDQALFDKCRMTLARQKNVLAGTAAEVPGRLIRDMSYQTALAGLRMQQLNRKLAALEELPDGEFEKALKAFTSGLESQEINEFIDLAFRLLERVNERGSEEIPGFIKQIYGQLDLYQIQDGFSALGTVFGEPLRPLGRAIVPDLIIGVCDILSPENDEFEDSAKKAREALRSLFKSGEGAP